MVDIPLVFGPSAVSPNGVSPPVGMIPFDAHSGSQENSLSCDQYPLSCDKHGADDILIMGSLSEIGTREISKWGDRDPLPTVSSVDMSPNSAHHNGLVAGKEWYQQAEEDLYSPPQDHSLLQEGVVSSLSGSQTSSRTGQSRKKNQKSLEALTRIGVGGSFDQAIVRGREEGREGRVGGDKFIYTAGRWGRETIQHLTR